MAEVRVRISTGRKFWLDERIQQAFPNDYVLDDPDKGSSDSNTDPATAETDNTGGTNEGGQA